MAANGTLSSCLRRTLESSTGKSAFGLFALAIDPDDDSDCAEETSRSFQDIIEQMMRPGDQKVLLNPNLVGVILTDLVDLQHLTLASLKLGRLFEPNEEDTGPKLTVNGGLVYLGRHPGTQEHIDAIIDAAADALQESVDKGTTCEVVTFDDAQIVDGHWEINSRLAKSMEHHHVTLDYLPNFRLMDGQIIGVEAIVRWRDRGEVIPSSEFMPALNDSTLLDLNIYCYRRVLREVIEYDINVPVAITIAPACLVQSDFEEFLSREATLWGVESNQLILEMAATTDFANIDAVIDVLRRLNEAGFKICIDDFGSGYANLERVKDLPINELKLDRSLTCRVLEDDEIAKVANGIVQFGDQSGISIVAAGIEDGATMEQLQQWGCATGQGSYLGLPLPVEELNKVRDIHENLATG